MYKVLKREMRLLGVTQMDIAILLGMQQQSICKRINGKAGEFSVDDAIKIQQTYFPGMSIDKLFRQEE